MIKETKNKKEVAEIIAGYSNYTKAEYKGIIFDRSHYCVETKSEALKVINERLEGTRFY